MTDIDESWWVRVLAGPGGDLHAATADERYVALPRSSDPRVVVDSSSRLAVRDAVERFVASRTENSMLRMVAGRGAPLVAKTKSAWSVTPSASNDTLRAHLSEVLGEHVRLAVAVGPPRPNRKPVVRCYNETELIAVAKLGPDPHTASMVSNESHWLRTLESEPLAGVSTPRLLHAGEFGDSNLLVMSAMDLKSDLGLAFADVPLSVVRELCERHRSGPLRESSWWSALLDRLDRPALAAIAEQARSTQVDPRFDQLETSAWHGDWSPWNMGTSTSGELYVWDWERTTIGVPVGFDLLHLHYQYGAGLAAADDDLRSLDVPDIQHELVKRLYLFEVCARHADADALHGDRHVRAVEALERLQSSGLVT